MYGAPSLSHPSLQCTGPVLLKSNFRPVFLLRHTTYRAHFLQYCTSQKLKNIEKRFFMNRSLLSRPLVGNRFPPPKRFDSVLMVKYLSHLQSTVLYAMERGRSRRLYPSSIILSIRLIRYIKMAKSTCKLTR